MDNLDYLFRLHQNNDRLGPGGDEETRLAIRLAGLDQCDKLKIADIGCGTGASALLLAQELDATIDAVDFAPVFLKKLEERAAKAGVSKNIQTHACSMDDLPFEHQSFDAIWSEGAIYNLGFEEGIRAWKPYLKPGGVLAVSELTWLTEQRPSAIEEHWNREYPQVRMASEKITILEKAGMVLLGYFALLEHCWMQAYYHPLQERFASYLKAEKNSSEAQAVVDENINEIRLYENYKDYFSYGFYIAKRPIS